jgi:hypothetical protein
MIALHKALGARAADSTVQTLKDVLAAEAAVARQPKKVKEMTDHAAATAEALEKVLALLRAGHSPEDLGETVILLGRLMARRT